MSHPRFHSTVIAVELNLARFTRATSRSKRFGSASQAAIGPLGLELSSARPLISCILDWIGLQAEKGIFISSQIFLHGSAKTLYQSGASQGVYFLI